MTATRAAEPRADARRNRDRVLVAAERLFAERGLAVPLDDIARAAGVGAGTVYRHFPTKDALFEAVMAQRIAQLGDRAVAALDHTDPAAAFYDFLAQAMEQARLNRALCDAMARHDEWRAAAEATGPHCRFREAFARLLASAQAADAVRADLDVDDVAALIPGWVAMSGHREDDAGARRLMRLLWDGLRPPATRRNVPQLRNETRKPSSIRNETPAVGRNEIFGVASAGDASLPVGEPVGRCPVCGTAVATAATGRRPTYCGAACRQKAHRRRAAGNGET